MRYYWRAWNHYNLKALEPAWADVEIAIKMLQTTNVYMLAGLIAYDRKDLPTAILRFDRSFELDVTNCDAVWMSGLVHVDQDEPGRWRRRSSRARMSCFSNAAAQAKSRPAALDAEVKRAGGPLRPPGREQRQRTKLTRDDAKLAAEQSAQSPSTPRSGYARTGERTHGARTRRVAIAPPANEGKGRGAQGGDREVAEVITDE